MSRPPYPEDLSAEIEVLNAAGSARVAERRLWTVAGGLVDRGALTVAKVAELIGVSERTVARRLAKQRLGQSRAAEGRAVAPDRREGP